MFKLPQPQTELKFWEFVALMAMMSSLAALSTDAMLPALAEIGTDLGVVRDNSNQLIVSLLFLGMAGGQILYGPVSDSVGRKPAIYAGYALFMIGSMMSLFAGSFGVMLAGRLLQGIGIAGPRNVSMALIRDKYEGRSMARVMSFVSVIFILVPIIAPAFGQAILLVAHWRAIFGSFLVLALIGVLWFAFRQPETLVESKRRPFSLKRISQAMAEVMSIRSAVAYTVVAGLMSAGFLGYLSTAQQIFQIQYGLGERFPLIFATLAVALGCASFLNGRLVMRLGMRTLATWASRLLVVVSTLFLVFAMTTAGQPPLWTLMGYLMITFLCVGVLFGNLNALAMQPLGHIAGVGAAIVGALSQIIAVVLSAVIGQSYNGTVLPLVAGFAIFSAAGMAIMMWTERGVPVAAEVGD
ncbi:MFS transporter [bacterium]|nr:MFS transporter [bacterium]